LHFLFAELLQKNRKLKDLFRSFGKKPEIFILMLKRDFYQLLQASLAKNEK
jgi:hypothetical protein